MDDYQIKDQIKATVRQASHTARQHVGTLMEEHAWQGRRRIAGTEVYPQRANANTRGNLRGKPRKTLKAGSIIPWSAGFEHLNLEQDNE